jgi:hypothetical protein
MSESKRGFWGRMKASVGLGGAVAALSVVAVMAWAAVTVTHMSYDPERMVLSVDKPEWGAEVFDAIHDSAIAQGLVRPANACGLGASSCFRCHNGQRAPEPATDPATAPWHGEHARVNHSCAGCHKGNPRLMREQMAHQGMIVDPRKSPDETCASCHRSASELEDLLARYQGIGQ